MDRDRAAAEVIARLGAARSAWNAADIRGEAEQLIARTGIVTPARVRAELAEDLTARALTLSVALLHRTGVPEHIRALTSARVLEVEADLSTRLATRGGADCGPVTGVPRDRGAALPVRGLDAAQTAATCALAGDAALVVVQGAAGAGKTTTLAATAGLLDLDGHEMVVVTPTLKAARVAATELGTNTGSAAWFAYQHGWRWDEHGTWTRLAPGDRDRVTGRPVAPPSLSARLRAGDLVVCDEAGMLDQDTARALLIIADEHHARLALIGDVHQLPAVGRGGVLELAERWADTCVVLDGVHRFTRTTHDTSGAEVTVPDRGYAELSLAMRVGEDPGAVFDQLHARGQVVVYPHPEDRTTHLADRAASALRVGRRGAVVADTREQVRDLNAAIRAARVADGQVTDPAAATTAIPMNPETPLTAATTVTAVITVAGERIGIGDVVATRRNDRDLNVANRDTWTVTAITEDGRLQVTGAGGPRTLTAGYVAEHVKLAYASTVYGVQGDTTDTSDVLLSEHSSAASTYVAMTRGREANTVHIVADTLDDAKEQWVAAFARDRADLGPDAARAHAERAAADYAHVRPIETVLCELRQAWTTAADAERTLARSRPQLERAVTAHAHDQAHQAEIAAITARQDRADQHLDTLTPQLRTAEHQVERASAALRDSLLSEWRADRAAAGEAARTVVAGPGRLWLHRRAVTDARALLQDWADKWKPITGDLGTGRGGVVTEAYPSGFIDQYEAVITGYAQARAVAAHPERAALAAAVHTARDEVRAARVAEWDARNAHAYSGGGGGYDWRGEIPRLEQVIATAERELHQAGHTIGRLERDPAILTQPRGYLDAVRTDWAVDRDLAADVVRQQAIAAAARRDERAARDRIRPTPTPQPAPERDHGISR